MIIIFLSSGLFLGWSLGANDAANIFGSAVGSRMLSFRKAAVIAAIFVILGAVVQGSGASHTLGKLGAVDAIAASFTVALSAAITVFVMTRYRIPVSTSQAIVGAIIGWNIYTGNATDYDSLRKILLTWVFCPILGAVFSLILYLVFNYFKLLCAPHLIRLDAFLRLSLIFVGALGAYSLGANNIANVMGVFIASVPIDTIKIGIFTFSGAQQLFFLGGIAIAIGIITYSKKIMLTVGNSLYKLSSESALVVVLAHALVLFIFSSNKLSDFAVSLGLPAIPLVPVSSSQAIVGAIIGIGILKGARGIKFSILGEIAIGWLTTPLIAGMITLFSLFFIDNVFNQEVEKIKTSQNTEKQKERNIFTEKMLDSLPRLKADTNRSLLISTDSVAKAAQSNDSIF